MSVPNVRDIISPLDDPYPGGDRSSFVVSSSPPETEAPAEKKTGIEAIPGKGELLEIDETKAARQVLALWKRQDVPMDRRDKYWRLYADWRRGRRGIFVDKIENTNIFRVWSVPGASNQPMPDRTDELVQRTVAQTRCMLWNGRKSLPHAAQVLVVLAVSIRCLRLSAAQWRAAVR